MIVDERYVTFLNSLDQGNTDFLNELEKRALDDNVPIIRRETQRLLKFLLEACQPKAILEVGTAVGFSALLMAQYSGPDTRITTIEKYEKRIPVARANFASTPLGDKIRFLEGDAAQVMEGLDGPYDMIFMDAAKGQYIHFLPQVRRLLAEGGMLVSDNVLQDGDVTESRFAVTRRDRTIHRRMRDYLYEISNQRCFTTTVLPVGDGVALTVYRTPADDPGDEK